MKFTSEETADTSIAQEKVCFHCNDALPSRTITYDDHKFCCDGCAMVYQLLSKSELCDYYSIDPSQQRSKVEFDSNKYAYLELEEIQLKLIRYRDEHKVRVHFYIPKIHCSSCIYLLENLHQLDSGFLDSEINFPRKELNVLYDPSQLSLRDVVEWLARIGYEPYLSLDDMEQKKPKARKDTLIRLGVAAFAFGNIMLLSFPEYLGARPGASDQLDIWFRYLTLILSIPVVFYCAWPFFVSAWKSMRQGILNIDAPVALAIGVTFLRSAYEVLVNQAPGFFDSMSGIVFFMLIGRYVQDRTYEWIHFERDYKSYFPLAVQTWMEGRFQPKALKDLDKKDLIQIGNEEIIPADGMLTKGNASLDYSFVTGESEIVEKKPGDLLYAGARHHGAPIEMQLIQRVSHSYLTSLWNKDIFKQDKERRDKWLDMVSHYFTWLVIAIAAVTAIYWAFTDSSMILNTLTAVLIIACPCTLLLAASFTNGFVLQKLNTNGLFLRSATYLEILSRPDVVVLDKTGTLTNPGDFQVSYDGAALSPVLRQAVSHLAGQSRHPLSKMLHASLGKPGDQFETMHFEEKSGAGIAAQVAGYSIRLGSAAFCDVKTVERRKGSAVFLSVNNTFYGVFYIRQHFRAGIAGMLSRIQKQADTHIISGDTDQDATIIRMISGEGIKMKFNQLPEQKLEWVHGLQTLGKRVIMIGDGLNDAGALRQSDLGVAVSNADHHFTPSSDAIIRADKLHIFDRFIRFALSGRAIISLCFGYSLIYNAVGIYFAVTGALSPLVAAIIMPASSLSIVGLSWILVQWKGKGLDEMAPKGDDNHLLD
jgi:Cu+-exporting ATPase